jgi:hypothetical protein
MEAFRHERNQKMIQPQTPENRAKSAILHQKTSADKNNCLQKSAAAQILFY